MNGHLSHSVAHFKFSWILRCPLNTGFTLPWPSEHHQYLFDYMDPNTSRRPPINQEFQVAPLFAERWLSLWFPHIINRGFCGDISRCANMDHGICGIRQNTDIGRLFLAVRKKLPWPGASRTDGVYWARHLTEVKGRNWLEDSLGIHPAKALWYCKITTDCSYQHIILFRLMPKGINILGLYCLFLSLSLSLSISLSLFLISPTQHFKLA